MFLARWVPFIRAKLARNEEISLGLPWREEAASDRCSDGCTTDGTTRGASVEACIKIKSKMNTRY